MNKQNVVADTYNGVLGSHKKNKSDTCYHMDEPWKHDVMWNKLDTKEQYDDSTYVKHLEKANSYWQKLDQMVTGAEERGEWGIMT